MMSESIEQTDVASHFWEYYRINFKLHVVFLLMSAAVLLCSVLMTSHGESTVRVPGVAFQMPETCMSRRVWGIDCPGCGLTRSFISMSHGQFGRAFSFNPAGPIVYLFVLVQIPWHLYQMFRLWKRRRPIESVWLYSGLFLISGAVLIQWLWRFSQGDLF